MLAASIALTGLSIAPASALSYKAATCTDSDSVGNGTTYYQASDGYNRVQYYEVLLTHNNESLGNKNNVDIQHKKNNFGGGTVLQHYTSGDNFPGNVVKNVAATSNAKTKTSDRAHTRYEFDFDTAGPDDNCNVDTANF